MKKNNSAKSQSTCARVIRKKGQEIYYCTICSRQIVLIENAAGYFFLDITYSHSNARRLSSMINSV